MGQKCQSLPRCEADKMNNASPTILRTRHKFGDYLSQPDIAKFELPKKMSRPWIVNNAYEQEKLKELIVTEAPVEASQVMLQIKESKAERRKHVGYNKKHVRNINEIIEKDHKTVKDSKKKVSTEEEAKRGNICQRGGGRLEAARKMTQSTLRPTWLNHPTCLVRRRTSRKRGQRAEILR